jgi:Asp-tRNA(Asn)/Glu-tRNA(Gln) amidotransferase C subunit
MNSLAEIIYKKKIDECTVEDLQQLTKKYPYFNAGHLLAVKKTQLENESRLPEFLQIASLHFHPFLLNTVLVETGNANIILTNSTEAVTQSIIRSEAETRSDNQQITVEEQPVKNNPQTEIYKVEPTTDFEPSIPIIEQPLTNIEETVTNNQQPTTRNEDLSFEPFHTVDYFASQGIKIKLDENATDKFSKQLKSFTEWLKTMKKLPTGETITEPATNNFKTTDSTVEAKVELLAETSLNKADVITEAMAEVWEKQGNPEKAIEIYQKLSLLEPSKSPYFATRISDLKKTD